jgi:alpha-aminoadipate carrier protein LysW
MRMVKVKCPVCGEMVDIPEDVLPGELIEHDCGALLEVVFENGEIKLRIAEDVGEDWGE